MTIIKKSSNGIDYLIGILKEKSRIITRVMFWKIPHRHKEKLDISLKIGRYKKNNFNIELPESASPKSELTLDNEEFDSLITFLEENYEPFKRGVKKYVPLDEKFRMENISHLRAVFDNKDKEEVLNLIVENDLLPEDIISSLEYQKRIKEITRFEKMLNENLYEKDWQKWFKDNDWVLGTEFVRILDEREIDTKNISDYLVKAYDGFLDIIEIKRPTGSMCFWAQTKDHDNYIPSVDLIKAITQAIKYIHEVEREANSIKFLERVNYIKTIKPRCVLIFGRSDDWDKNKREAYRILNSSYHNLTIMTYDHVLMRAKRILGLDGEEKNKVEENIDF